MKKRLITGVCMLIIGAVSFTKIPSLPITHQAKAAITDENKKITLKGKSDRTPPTRSIIEENNYPIYAEISYQHLLNIVFLEEFPMITICIYKEEELIKSRTISTINGQTETFNLIEYEEGNYRVTLEGTPDIDLYGEFHHR